MSVVIVNDELASVLGSMRECTELRTSEGRSLGVFTPACTAEEDRLKSLFDLEEAERILATEKGKGRQLREIWRDLESKGISEP
jgi:hypothetical protein